MTNTTRIGLRIFLVALVLLVIGSVLVTARTPDAGGRAVTQDALAAPCSYLVAGQSACYTIDTSRPEWLGGWTVIHLPLVLKIGS